MATLLQIVGFVWAALGVLNIAMQDWSSVDAVESNSFALIFNMALFVLPGLIVGGMGHSMAKRKVAAAKPASVAERLARLDDLLAARKISRDEYDRQRARIIEDT